MSETPEPGHWFHRVSLDVRRWLASEPATPLTQDALEAVIGAGGTPVKDPDTGDFHVHPEDQEYIRELHRSGVDDDADAR